jgi:hypothetical protein
LVPRDGARGVGGSHIRGPRRPDGRQNSQQEQAQETTAARTCRQMMGKVQINHNGVFSIQFHFQWAGSFAHR